MKRNCSIILLIAMLALAMIASASTMKKTLAQAQPYYSITPSTIMMGPSSDVGQTFTVTVWVNGTTLDNVPAGVGGIEVHVTWNSSLLTPTSATNQVTLPGGAFYGASLLYTLNGFYDANGNKVNAAPYTNATHWEVAGASTTGPWSGSGGMIAQITFQIDQQTPPFVTCPIAIDFTDMVDGNEHEVSLGASQNAVYTNLAVSTIPETINFAGVGSFVVTIDTDSNLTVPANMDFQNYTSGGASFDFNVTTYDGFCNVTVPNNFMWSIPTTSWTVLVDGLSPPSSDMSITYDSTNAYIWLNFTSGSHTIFIESTNVVPEYASMTSLMLVLMTMTLAGAAATISLRKKKLHF